jgi:protein-disulfide isomerase
MKIGKTTLVEIATWALVLCAILSTALVVRREFVPSPSTAPMGGQARYVDDWEDTLQAGIRSGDEDAPLQVVEFVDFQCPFCAHFESIVGDVREEYPDQVAFTFVHLPISRHEFAEDASRVAECAYEQGRFDSIRPLLFKKQASFGSISWTEIATEAAILDIERFDKCLADPQINQKIEQGKLLANKFNVQGVPTILINGWKWQRPPSLGDFDQIVNNVMLGRPLATDIDYANSGSDD